MQQRGRYLWGAANLARLLLLGGCRGGRGGGGGGGVCVQQHIKSSSFTITTQSNTSSNRSQREKENKKEYKTNDQKWMELIAQQTKKKPTTEYNIINPCNSESHPAVRLGLAKIDRSKPKRSLQEAYDPFASCFVCSKSGRLRLETRRTKDAKILQSKLENGVPETYVELPGIVAPGMIASVMSCAGSWHGSIALMDKAVLARPPLMMLEKMLDFTAVDVLAPNEKCSVQSEIVSLDEPNFATVKLEMTVGGHAHEQDTDTITSTNSTSTRESKQHVCARAVMRFKKIGAVRSIS
tara:strand:- start:11100 stop:11984 length:885 start_codon:yes stop_codon:yes gene_type:complete